MSIWNNIESRMEIEILKKDCAIATIVQSFSLSKTRRRYSFNNRVLRSKRTSFFSIFFSFFQRFQREAAINYTGYHSRDNCFFLSLFYNYTYMVSSVSSNEYVISLVLPPPFPLFQVASPFNTNNNYMNNNFQF